MEGSALTSRSNPSATALLERLDQVEALRDEKKSVPSNASLRQEAVADLVDLIITSDDAEGSKPDPDLVEAALDKPCS